ncbi:MAG: hypothetical protein WHS65_10100 [Melioribacteraceae bacterium]
MKEWYKEIDYKKFLDGDMKLLEEIIGIDKLMKLFEIFSKTAIYFSEKPIMEMKQEYIRKKFGSIPEKQLARLLNVSERLVYKIGSQKITLNDQIKLFE